MQFGDADLMMVDIADCMTQAQDMFTEPVIW